MVKCKSGRQPRAGRQRQPPQLRRHDPRHHGIARPDRAFDLDRNRGNKDRGVSRGKKRSGLVHRNGGQLDAPPQ